MTDTQQLAEDIKRVMRKNGSGLYFCPYCQKSPIIGLGERGNCQLHGEPFQAITIFCSNRECKAPMKVSAGDIFNGGEPKARAEAVKEWNNHAYLLTHDIIRRQQEVIRELVYGFEHIKTWHVPTNSCAASSLCEHIQTTLDNLTPLLEISNDK